MRGRYLILDRFRSHRFHAKVKIVREKLSRKFSRRTFRIRVALQGIVNTNHYFRNKVVQYSQIINQRFVGTLSVTGSNVKLHTVINSRLRN